MVELMYGDGRGGGSSDVALSSVTCSYYNTGDDCNPCSTRLHNSNFRGCGYHRAKEITKFLAERKRIN